MAETSGVDYIDRLLTGASGAVLLKENGVALQNLTDKLDFVGNVEIEYTPPGENEKYGKATVTISGVQGGQGVRGSRWFSTTGSPTFAGLQFDMALDIENGNVYQCWADGVNWNLLGSLREANDEPVALTVGGENAAGSGNAVALSNHVHGVAKGTPVSVGMANAAGESGDFADGSHVHALPFSVLQSVLGGATGAISVNYQRVTNGASPEDDTDLATKAYVDAHSQGLVVHEACAVMIPYLAASSMTGLGATYDGVTVTSGMRIFVARSNPAAASGPWVANSGAWTRPTDYATGGNGSGAYFLITGGTTYTGNVWAAGESLTGGYVIDTDNIVFNLFSRTTTISAGSGLTRVSNTINVVCDDGSLTVDADAVRVNSVAWSLLSGVPGSFAPSAHAASHLSGGADFIGYPSNTVAGLVAPITAANRVYGSTSGTGAAWMTIVDAMISTNANIIPNKLAKGAVGEMSLLTSDGAGNNAFTTLSALGVVGTNRAIVKKDGTHRSHRFHDEIAFVCSTDNANPSWYYFEEATWKGDAEVPNSATWDTRATVTIKLQYIDSVSYEPIDRTYKAQLYWLRTGGNWGISGGTQLVETLGTPSGTVTVSVYLTGTHRGTINVAIVQFPDMTNKSDMVMFVDIEGGGNYAS